MSPSLTTDLVLIAWGVWGLGCVGLLLVGALKLMPGSVTNLWRLMASEGAFIALATTPFLLGGTFVAVAFAIVAARIGWESAHVSGITSGLENADLNVHRIMGAILMVALAMAGWVLPGTAIAVMCVAILCLRLMLAATSIMASRAAIGALLATTAFPGIAIGLFAAGVHAPEHYAVAVLAFIYVEVFDSMALFGGKLFGRHPAFPKLSPKKTVEGLATGLVALLVVSAVLNVLLVGAATLLWLALVLAAVVGAIAGDLLASAPKRAAGVKDYPAIYEPQGGVLDMTDAWLVAVPATLAVAWLTGT
jgi:phosphatidate cytidylyltransferase